MPPDDLIRAEVAIILPQACALLLPEQMRGKRARPDVELVFPISLDPPVGALSCSAQLLSILHCPSVVPPFPLSPATSLLTCIVPLPESLPLCLVVFPALTPITPSAAHPADITSRLGTVLVPSTSQPVRASAPTTAHTYLHVSRSLPLTLHHRGQHDTRQLTLLLHSTQNLHLPTHRIRHHVRRPELTPAAISRSCGQATSLLHGPDLPRPLWSSRQHWGAVEPDPALSRSYYYSGRQRTATPPVHHNRRPFGLAQPELAVPAHPAAHRESLKCQFWLRGRESF